MQYNSLRPADFGFKPSIAKEDIQNLSPEEIYATIAAQREDFVKRKTSTTTRLRRIEGQVRGLSKMIEENKDCEEVLIQISSVISALRKTGQVVLQNHLNECVTDAIRAGEGEEAVKKLSSAIEQFSRII
jgi:DNA-binding FrmR family transcriptional regulator